MTEDTDRFAEEEDLASCGIGDDDASSYRACPTTVELCRCSDQEPWEQTIARQYCILTFTNEFTTFAMSGLDANDLATLARFLDDYRRRLDDEEGP